MENKDMENNDIIDAEKIKEKISVLAEQIKKDKEKVKNLVDILISASGKSKQEVCTELGLPIQSYYVLISWDLKVLDKIVSHLTQKK